MEEEAAVLRLAVTEAVVEMLPVGMQTGIKAQERAVLAEKEQMRPSLLQKSAT